MNKLSILIFSLLTSLSYSVNAQDQDKPLPFDSAVVTGELANGFTFYIRHNEEPKNRVLFYLVTKAGSMQEDDDQRGLAHFMEHMSFNGTRHYPKNQLIDYLQKSGVRFGADLNAYTSFDETVYQLPLPSDDPDLLQHGLQIMRDWAQDATLQTEEINKERGVVLEEKRLRTGAGQRLMEQYFPMQVNGSRYADRLPIGTESILKNFHPGVIRKFYQDWYRPNLQALIVVGDIDVAKMKAIIVDMFKDLCNPVKERKLLKRDIGLLNRNQFMALTDPEQTVTQAIISIKQPGLRLRTAADYKASIVRELFNSILSERIAALSQKPNASFVKAQTGLQSFMGGLDAFTMSIISKPGKLKESMEEVWTETERLKQTGVTSSELERAKTDYNAFFERALAEKNKTSSESYVREYLEFFLHQTASPGIEAEFKLVQDLLPRISTREIHALAQAVIKDNNRDILLLAPEKDRVSLPDESTVNVWIQKIEGTNLAAYSDDFKQQALLPKVPVPGRITSRQHLENIGVSIYTLSNGATVWLKPTSFKNDELLLSCFSEGGTSLYPDSVFQSAANAGNLIAAFGIAGYNPVDLSKILNGKTVQLQPYIQERWQGLNGRMSPKDMETAMQLLYLHFTASRKDSGLFSNIIARSKGVLQNRSSDPQAILSDSTTAILGGYHYRRLPPKPAQLDSINLDKVYEIYQDCFSGAGNFTFVFSGSIDTTRLLPLVEQYIGALPIGKRTDSARDLGIRIPAGRQTHIVIAGTENKANVRLVYSGDYPFNESNNMQLEALGAILEYRMLERIRETEGGAYAPQAGVSYGKYPSPRYAFNIVFTCAPSNVEKLLKAVDEEIDRLKTGGPSAEDIQKFIAEQTRMNESQQRTNKFWNSYLTYVLQNREDPENVLHETERLKEVSARTVQETATRYLNQANFIKIIQLPVGR